MGQHRHHPKASVQLMYNASQFFTTGTEFQCYKCKATVVLTLAGRLGPSQILCKLQMKREQIRIQCARQRIYPTAAHNG